MTIYSAHDTTVFSLLAALAATENAHLPGYTAHVVAELWESWEACDQAPSFSVRLLYDDEVLKDSPACEEGQCSLDYLVNATKDSAIDPADCKRESLGVNHLFSPEDQSCCPTAKS